MGFNVDLKEGEGTAFQILFEMAHRSCVAETKCFKMVQLGRPQARDAILQSSLSTSKPSRTLENCLLRKSGHDLTR